MSSPASEADALQVRAATPADVAAITRVYNEGIADRLATLETEERSQTEPAAWLAGRDARLPVLVAVRGDEVAGWSSLNPFSPRPAYGLVADISVYVDRSHRGAGVGGALLTGLIVAARRMDYHKLVLAAFPFNEAGMRLYRRHNFREVGIYREQGQLDGHWVDTVIMELLLNEVGSRR